MGRFGKVGVFGQVTHPRIRGDLDPSHQSRSYGKVLQPEDCNADEASYFVPSFSIRRHLHRSEELRWETQQQLMKKRLGRAYEVTPVANISLKIVEQHQFIKRMREANIKPEPDAVKDLAYKIRDRLTDLLFNAYSPLDIPLGNLEKFGYKEDEIAYEIDGWRGDRSPYAENDQQCMMDALAALHAERQLAVGSIALAFEDTDLATEGMAPSPHVTIARYKESVAPWRMREIRSELGDLALQEAYFGDPVIDIKLYRDQPSETIHIKHAWESLAPMPTSLAVPAVALESAFDRFDALAENVRYA